MRETNCHYCGQQGFWSWSSYKKQPVLVVDDEVHRCAGKDIFPGWCNHCKRTDLLLVRKEWVFQLTENYGLPHTCTEDGQTEIEDVSAAKCKYCSNAELFWVSERGRWTLRVADGSKHTCEKYSAHQKAWAEALRINYAHEKVWVNSKPDNAVCKKCNGVGHRVVYSRNKRLMLKHFSSEPITVLKLCRHCKCLGKFTPTKKKDYLKRLRLKYWPYRPGTHKWKKDNGTD